MAPTESLTRTERAVIDMRIGTCDCPPGEPLEAVGRKFNITRERIRLIEDKMLRIQGNVALLYRPLGRTD